MRLAIIAVFVSSGISTLGLLTANEIMAWVPLAVGVGGGLAWLVRSIWKLSQLYAEAINRFEILSKEVRTDLKAVRKSLEESASKLTAHEKELQAHQVRLSVIDTRCHERWVNGEHECTQDEED